MEVSALKNDPEFRGAVEGTFASTISTVSSAAVDGDTLIVETRLEAKSTPPEINWSTLWGPVRLLSRG
jgi:hypothetical protein